MEEVRNMRRTYEQLKKLKVKVIEDKKKAQCFTIHNRQMDKRKRSPKVLPGMRWNWSSKTWGAPSEQKRIPQLDRTALSELSLENHPQASQRKKKKQEEVIVPQNIELLPPKTNQSLSSVGTAVYAPRSIPATSTPPLTPEEMRRLTRCGLFGAGGIATGEAILEKRLPWWGRAALLLGAGIVFWIGGKIQRQTPNLQTE